MRVSKDELYLQIAELKEENSKIREENKDLRFDNDELREMFSRIARIVGDGRNFVFELEDIKNELDAYQNNLVQ